MPVSRSFLRLVRQLAEMMCCGLDCNKARRGIISLGKTISRLKSSPSAKAIGIALIYITITLYITIRLLHDSYNTYALDLGAFTQSLKYTLQGKLLWHPTVGGSELAHHFSPVLLFLVPVYWLFPFAQTLLVVQALVLGFSGYLVYILTRDAGYNLRTSLVIEAIFLINPLVWGVALFDFHPVVFAVPALMVMFLGIKRNSRILVALGLFFALISKEDVIIAIAAFGVTLLIDNYWRGRVGSRLPLVIMCSAVVAYGIAVAVSAVFSNGESPRMLSYFTSRYIYTGQPTGEAVLSVIKVIFSTGSLFTFLAYLAPLTFIPLLSLRWSIPGLLLMLSGMLSTTMEQHDELRQYPAAAIPFLFMAFIVSLEHVRKEAVVQSLLNKFGGRMQLYALSLLILMSLSYISWGRVQEISFPDAHDEALNKIIAAIPDDTTVTANNDILPHLCSRTDTYLPRWMGPGTGIINGIWGFPDRDTEYVVVDSVHKQYYIRGYWEDVTKRELNKKYELIENVDGAKLYKLRPHPNID